MDIEHPAPGPKVALLRWSPTLRRNGRTAVRSLARLLLGPAERWRLDAPPGARPRLLPAPDSSVNHVSLSHTRSAAAAAIAMHPIGVDVESIHRRANWARIARARFSRVEQAWLERQAENERKTAFLALWTCKEAWLKAQGQGLEHLDTARFEPFGSDQWLVPGTGWRAETRLLAGGLMVSVLWQGGDRPLWLQSQTGDIDEQPRPAPDCQRRWRGAAPDSQRQENGPGPDSPAA